MRSNIIDCDQCGNPFCEECDSYTECETCDIVTCDQCEGALIECDHCGQNNCEDCHKKHPEECKEWPEDLEKPKPAYRCPDTIDAFTGTNDKGKTL